MFAVNGTKSTPQEEARKLVKTPSQPLLYEN